MPHPIQTKTPIMLSRLAKSRAGFTLVEIMIVVAIIALLAAIAVPNFMRARKRAQATMAKNDLRILNDALDTLLTEHAGSPEALKSALQLGIQPYIKSGTRLYNTGADLLNNGYYVLINGIPTVGNIDMSIGISTATYNELSDVAPLDFWSPYVVGTND